MAPFIVLVVSLFLFRLIGALGVEALDSWQDATRFALALMFLFTASAHFTRMKQDLITMVPSAFPYPKEIVFVTGILEILGAIGLLIPSLKVVAGICLIALMVAMFPANINAARKKIPLRGKSPTPLWLRLPLQLVFIGLTWWAIQT